MKELNNLFVSFVLSLLLAGPIFADIIELNDENDSCSASSKSDFGWITHHLYTNNLLQCDVQLKPEARTLAGTTSQTNDVILITRFFLTGGSAKVRINDVAVSSLKKGDMPGIPDNFPPCYVLAPMEMSSACEKKIKNLEDRQECKVLYSQEGQVTSVKFDIRSRGYVNMFAHYQFYRCDPTSRDEQEEEKEPESTKTDDTQKFYIIIIAVISGCLVLIVAIFSFNNCRRRKPSGTNHTPSSQTTSISTINQPSAPAINMRPLASLPRGTTKTPPPCYQEFAEYEECGPTAPPGGSASNSCGGGGGWSGKSPDSPRYVSPQPAYNFANDEDPTYCELGDN